MKRVELKEGNMYFVINTDEPYAEEIYEALKAGQIAKGDWPEGADMTFEEWLSYYGETTTPKCFGDMLETAGMGICHNCSFTRTCRIETIRKIRK